MEETIKTIIFGGLMFLFGYLSANKRAKALRYWVKISPPQPSGTSYVGKPEHVKDYYPQEVKSGGSGRRGSK